MHNRLFVDLGEMLVLSGFLIMIGFVVPKLLELKRQLESPRVKAAKFAKQIDKKGINSKISDWASSDLRDFKTWLRGGTSYFFNNYSTLEDIGDDRLGDIPEFNIPSQDLLHQQISKLTKMLVVGVSLVIIGLVLIR